MNSSEPATTDPLAERLAAKGLRLARLDQVIALHHDPRFGQGQIVFVDARNDEHYQAGHIPGAFQFDHYRAENYLASVLPVCFVAEEIVVYCGGGDCEDSEFAAIMLRDAGVPGAKLLIYGGGMKEWTSRSLPEETGARNSGVLKARSP